MSAAPGLGLLCPEETQLPSLGLQRSRRLSALALRSVSLWWREWSQDSTDVAFEGPLGFPWGVSLEAPCGGCTLLSYSRAGLHETLALLTSQLRPDSNHKEEMGFLKDVFSEKSLGYLMKVQPHLMLSCEGF